MAGLRPLVQFPQQLEELVPLPPAPGPSIVSSRSPMGRRALQIHPAGWSREITEGGGWLFPGKVRWSMHRQGAFRLFKTLASLSIVTLTDRPQLFAGPAPPARG